MPIVTIVLLVVVVVLLLALLMKTSKIGSPVLDSRLDAFEKAQERTERAVREEVAQSRDELGRATREQRQELTEAFKGFGDSLANQLASIAQTSGERLDGVRAESSTGAKQLREEVVATLNSISETMAKTIKDLAVAEKAQLEAFS